MIVFPAIDIQGGKVVRLRQGVKEDSTTYFDDPVKTAVKWRDEGAMFLHVVDLDGAFPAIAAMPTSLAASATPSTFPSR